jgi:light-regulated signal transduction histidine kinase (bacteriophytochrome)
MDLIVNQVIKEIELENENQKIDWKIGELGEVKADPALVKQLWFNLISNSIKFSREKKKPLIEIGKLSENGHKTWFIKDNGAGFDNRYSDKLFGVFQRLHTEEEFEGTGIGLATVKRIIDRHKGKIWAESSPGEGAAFYFHLS